MGFQHIDGDGNKWCEIAKKNEIALFISAFQNAYMGSHLQKRYSSM